MDAEQRARRDRSSDRHQPRDCSRAVRGDCGAGTIESADIPLDIVTNGYVVGVERPSRPM